MAIAVTPLITWALLAERTRFHIPYAAVAAVVLSVVPLLQWVFGVVRYPGDAWLAALYLLGFAGAIIAGARMQRAQPWLLQRLLFASFGMAALASFGLALYQWLSQDWLGLLAYSPPYARPMANLAQPNNLATLLVWGVVAFWWAYLTGRVSGVISAVAAGLLLFGIAMTQSRAGALEVLLLGLVAVMFRGQLGIRRNASALILLGLWFVLVFAAWASLNGAMLLPQVPSIAQRMAPDSRILVWSLLVEAALQRPWTGWGWNQVVFAQVALAPKYPAIREVFSHSHNLVLDLVLWNGIPVALAACGALVLWCVRQVRQAATPERVMLLTAVGAFLVHAQFELPHSYLLFLLPVGLMVGALHGAPEDRWHIVAPWKVVALPLAALALCLGLVIRDYVHVEEAWTAHRMRAARIGAIDPAPVPRTVVLTHLQAILETVQLEPRRGMPPEEIEKLRFLAERQPGVGSLFRSAQALALNNRGDEASQALDVLCRLHRDAECASAKAAWMALADDDMPEMRGAWPHWVSK